ncbi:MAG: hypothetical protein LPK19_16105 [Hymenobacteraceae bacterium]|nr:hypothetical protein [Hymenobacteraceae bacterium]MDX5397766.1 hypothetical protein [Hymenobacteraceae bacterium]MDX5513843.1 hypothetical protein [Hymenobacteraceae bacterium]
MAQKLFLLLFCWLVSGVGLLAQPSQPARLEINASPATTRMQVLPLPDSSVIVFQQSSPFFSRKEKHELVKYNGNLQPIWNLPLDLPPGTSYYTFFADRHRVYLLFLTRRSTEFKIMVLNTNSATYTLSDYVAPAPVTIQQFKVLGDVAFITVLEDKEFVRLLHLNLHQKEGVYLPALYEKATALSDFRVDTTTMRAEVVLSHSFGKKSRLQIKRFAPTGELLSSTFLFDRSQNNLTDARLLPGDSLHKRIAGIYATRDLRYGQGLFTAQLPVSTEASINYFPFTTFSHFFDYMPPRRQQRVLRKVERQKNTERGYLLRKYMLLHPLLPGKNGYVVLAESVTPQYRSNSFSGNFRNSLPMREFEGFRHLHVVVSGFDSTGNMRWQNSYPLKNLLTEEAETTVEAGMAGDTVVLAYLHHEQVQYKIINKNQETDNNLQEPIRPANPSDKIMATEYEAMQHWYGANFLVYGYQRVRSLSGETRQVFFINKFSFGSTNSAENP